MSVVWLAIKIIIYTFALNLLFRQTYFFIFILAKRPMAWIIVIALLGIANMWLAYMLAWDPRLVSAATLTAIILNITPSIPRGFSKNEFDTVYEECGIKHGWRKSRIGLVVFALLSLVAYMLFFGQICTLTGECTPVIWGLLS